MKFGQPHGGNETKVAHKLYSIIFHAGAKVSLVEVCGTVDVLCMNARIRSTRLASCEMASTYCSSRFAYSCALPDVYSA